MSKNVRHQYSDAFKYQVLEDYVHSRMSKLACCRKWEVPDTTFRDWLSSCTNEKKVVSLQSKSQNMDATNQVLENLRQENARLKQENEFQKLRIAGYERLLEIVKQEDGIDLLKKDGAKQ